MAKRAAKPTQRGLKRSHLVYYLRVFTTDTHRLLGHVADITPEGLMVVSEQPVQVGREMGLRVVLPRAINGRVEVELGALSLWSRGDANPDLYDTGFRFVHIDDDDRAVIRRLVEEYGFADHLD
jgi:hypothetical protein